MVHSRVLSSFASSTSSSLHQGRLSDGCQAELLTVACQRGPQPCASTSSRPSTAQRGLLCLPRHLAACQSRPGPASAHSQALTACSALPAFQTPAAALVPVRVVSDNSELKPMPRAVENVADDPAIANPLARQNRLSPAWMGVVMEYEGVVVEETSELHRQAWVQLAEEEGKTVPMQWALKRADGMKAEQAIQEVFCWTRNFTEVRRLARRKEQLYCQLLGNQQPMVALGLQALLHSLSKNQVPAVLAAAEPEQRLKSALDVLGLEKAFAAVVSAEDVSRGRPDPEAYLYAAQQLGRPPVRCVVIGNSNQSVEAARECGMAAVVVAGRRPLYELGAADLVVKQLDELSMSGLKQLFRMEDLVEPQEQLELEVAPEREAPIGMSPYATDVYH